MLDVLPLAPSPASWPIAGQVVLLLLVSDGLRYALHVAAHRFEPLWRLHAVHHRPEKLYALNVVRFHPLEKTLQLGLDTLPFVIVAVGTEVLSLYLVIHAIHGFLQHASIDLRLGPLNGIVSGPELHRWHHSRDIAESHHNFGNNLILWDVLFGTRFLPPPSVFATSRHWPLRIRPR
jgi:sterol desaturase/sphingolipid hydroxylase (fatty acid hydroxylase superfamily)